MSRTIHQLLKGQALERVPFWFMRQAGRYLPEYRQIRSQFPHFLDCCYDSDAAAEITLQPLARFDMDAAILFSDILVVPDALGRSVRFEAGEGPRLDPLSEQDIIGWDEAAFHHRLEPVYHTVKKVKSKLAEDKTLIGFAGSPWTVACYMVEGQGSKDFAATRQFAYRHPAAFTALIDRLTEATSAYLIRQIDHGADVVQLFDSWAGVLPPEGFIRYVTQPTAAIVKKIKAAHPDVPVIGFARQAGCHLAAYAQQTGVQGLGIDTSLDLVAAAAMVLPQQTVQGNLDPLVLATDLQQTLSMATARLEQMKNRPFIFNLGHGIVPHTPVDHVSRLSDRIRTYRP